MLSSLASLFVIACLKHGFSEPIRNPPEVPGKLERELTIKDYSKPQEVYEGDIILAPQQRDYFFSPEKNDKKSFVLDQYKWPSKVVNGENIVEIPYVIDSGVSSNVRKLFKEGVMNFNTLTCIRFIPRSSQADYIKLISGDGCYSSIGRTKGEQHLSLGSGCESLGHVIHENMHALGFFHEQARPDRDEFVRIYWDNIEPENKDQFEKYDLIHGINGDELRKYPYDMLSIMSYGKYDFSKNGKPSMEDKQNPGEYIGQMKFFSTGDLFEINSMYSCADRYLQAKKYKITVYTSDAWFSGTDSRVFLKIFGTSSDSGEIELKLGAFESGDVDVESHLLPDLTPIQNIVVWHSNEGPGAGWKLDKIIIKDTNTGEKFTFEYNGWLEGDPSSNRVSLTPN